MHKANKILFIILSPSLLWAQMLPTTTQQMPSVGRTHVFIDSTIMETQNQIKCELAVAVSKDKKEVRVMRLDHPKGGKTTLSYLNSNPQLVSKYGISYQLEDLIETNGHQISTVQASFDFDNNKRELILTVHFKAGVKVEKRVSIDQEFFKDHAKECLK